MRIEIKTGKPVKDPDLKALYLIREAMKISTPRMRKENARFALGKYGIKLNTKE